MVYLCGLSHGGAARITLILTSELRGTQELAEYLLPLVVLCFYYRH